MKGEVLKKFWKTSGITRKELAAKIGISESAVGQKFNSEDVSTKTLEQFCEVLNLKVNDMYEGTDLYYKPSTFPVVSGGSGNPNFEMALIEMIKEKERKIAEMEIEHKEERKNYERILGEKDKEIKRLNSVFEDIARQRYDVPVFEKTEMRQVASEP